MAVSKEQLTPSNTPLISNSQLNAALQQPHLHLKLEENNPNHSHKDRALSHQLILLSLTPQKVFAISSTGNAAISANIFAKKLGLSVITFITPNISHNKLQILASSAQNLIMTERPFRMLSYLEHRYTIPSLNATHDPESIIAYKQIGVEIFETLPTAEAIVIFVSSGSTFLGIAIAYEQLLNEKKISAIPQLFAVQILKTTLPGVYKSTVHQSMEPLSSTLLEERKQQIEYWLRKSKGNWITIADEEILDTRALLQNNHQDTSPEGCATIAAIGKIPKIIKSKSIVTLLTGNANQWEDGEKNKAPVISIPLCNSIQELDSYLYKNNLV
ncbi:MAG: pyridoxal-phosphate dependent enzyme [bacterium]